ncbi:MAG: acyl carrier protein [Bdellovibrionales bacterium]|nr:acyl carrier protein [Bdellovibrionales bacterium]
MSIEERVLEVFRDVFDDPNLQVTAETNASHVDDWDSFNHINLIVSLEEAFDVKFSTQEIGSMTCVGDLYTLLREKGATA